MHMCVGDPMRFPSFDETNDSMQFPANVSDAPSGRKRNLKTLTVGFFWLDAEDAEKDQACSTADLTNFLASQPETMAQCSISPLLSYPDTDISQESQEKTNDLDFSEILAQFPEPPQITYPYKREVPPHIRLLETTDETKHQVLINDLQLKIDRIDQKMLESTSQVKTEENRFEIELVKAGEGNYSGKHASNYAWTLGAKKCHLSLCQSPK